MEPIVQGPRHGIVHGGCPWCRPWTSHGPPEMDDALRGTCHGCLWRIPWTYTMGVAMESSLVHHRLCHRRRHGSAKYHGLLHGTYHGSMDGVHGRMVVHGMVRGIIHGRLHGILHGRRHGVGCPWHRSWSTPWHRPWSMPWTVEIMQITRSA